jgi:regulator of protease activity HflC (stomatin/prohibitin superfamily)
MFDRLLDLLIQMWGQLKPAFIVDVYQLAGVLRFGKYHRSVEPGLHWKIPFAERTIEVISCVTTVRLPAQPLTTKDNVTVTVGSILKYQIVDAEPYITGIFDQHDVLIDVTMGAIRRHIAAANYEDLLANLPEDSVLKAVRAEVNRYGFKVHNLTFTAFTKARPIMLISQTVLKNIDN